MWPSIYLLQLFMRNISLNCAMSLQDGASMHMFSTYNKYSITFNVQQIIQDNFKNNHSKNIFSKMNVYVNSQNTKIWLAIWWNVELDCKREILYVRGGLPVLNQSVLGHQVF